MATVVIDPGHGGTEAIGGSSPNNAVGPVGLLEKHIALDLAQRVRQDLATAGIAVHMTRDSDMNVGLDQRARIARDASADAFVSIHFNSFDGKVQGSETYHHRSASGDSKALATLVQSAVAKATGLRDRGVKAEGFTVLRPEHHAPATAGCLVEISFIDVADEEMRLQADDYKDRIAAGLAGAIRGWLVADGRLPFSGRAAGTAAHEVRRREAAQDGYEAACRTATRKAMGEEDHAAAPRVSGTFGDMPIDRANAGADGHDASQDEVVPGIRAVEARFLVEPGRHDLGGAGGVTDLRSMLRGWRKERLCPPDSDDLVFEVAIGRDESLEAVFLDLLARQRQAVGIIRLSGIDPAGNNIITFGTGFLVARNIVLTNHHVLDSSQAAAAATIAFDYELSAQAVSTGRKESPSTGRTYRLDPERLFVTSPADGGLDYSFVWIDDVEVAERTPIRMERAAFAIQQDERAFIIHHPEGRPKRVSLDDTDIVSARPDGAVIHYTSDTEGGSSGSPVFDRSGRLIALHHAARGNSGGLTTADGLTPKYVNEGIKLAAIALDLETRRASGPSAMIELVLGEIHGSDSLASFFGASGRTADVARPTHERVVELYHATAQDIDIGFWNTGFLSDGSRKVDDAARMIVDMGLDIWALSETSPASAQELADTIERKFGLRFACEHADSGTLPSRQSASVLWNPTTVVGRQVRWPDEIAPLFDLGVDGVMQGARPEAGQRIFDRPPGLFHFEGGSKTGQTMGFYLLTLHLQAFAEGRPREQATQILARAVVEMIAHHGAATDWILGADMNGQLASGAFASLAAHRFAVSSAQDEAGSALCYLAAPDSLVDRVFLSPNMSRLHGPQAFFTLTTEKNQVDYLARFADHRPVLARLSARTKGTAPRAPGERDSALAARLDAMLQQPRGV